MNERPSCHDSSGSLQVKGRNYYSVLRFEGADWMGRIRGTKAASKSSKRPRRARMPQAGLLAPERPAGAAGRSLPRPPLHAKQEIRILSCGVLPLVSKQKPRFDHVCRLGLRTIVADKSMTRLLSNPWGYSIYFAGLMVIQ